MNPLALAQGFQLLAGILVGGVTQYQQIVAIMRANGYAGDTNALQDVIVDAEKRAARRAEEMTAEQ